MNELEKLKKEKQILINQYRFFKKILDEPAKGERRIYAQKHLDDIDAKGRELSSKIKQIKS